MSAELNIYNPEQLGPPMGQYTHVTRVKANEFLFIAGMLSGDTKGNVIGEGDFDAAHLDQALARGQRRTCLEEQVSRRPAIHQRQPDQRPQPAAD